MKTPIVLKKPRKGFALVVTVSMMVLLTIVVVATLSLSTVTLRSVDKDAAQAVARANARLAMIMAIGELQAQAGPDRRITATAESDSKSAAPAYPQWTGVWKTGPDDEKSSWENAAPAWLVSGNDPGSGPSSLKPTVVLSDNESALLVSTPLSEPSRKEVRAKYVKVEGARMDGRYAWWIGDEGVKVRVDTSRPDEKPSELAGREGMSRSQAPLEPGFFLMDKENKEMWANFDPDRTNGIDKSSLASLGTLALAVDSGGVKKEELPAHYFNDITTGGFGIPTNVVDGGLKMDLSLLFDRSQDGSPAFVRYLGATPTVKPLLDSTIYNFSTPSGNENKLKFSLSETITNGNAGGFVGPNWGILYNYGRMWENVQGNSATMIGLNPRVGTDLRYDSWQPYKEAGKSSGNINATDVQHTNSGLSPVLSVVQMGFLLGAKLGTPGPPPERKRRYQAELLIKPIIGLWNPYNVTIRASYYKFEWALNPYLRFDYQKPSSNGTFPNGSGNVTEMWMRDYWQENSGGVIPTEGNQGGSYIRLKTPKVDFQPGEFRLFSVESNPVLAKDNFLVPTLDPKGAFRVTVLRSVAKGTAATNPDDQVGKPLQIEEGFYGWFGDVYMQDTLYDGTGGTQTPAHFQSKYGTALDMKAAATWMTFKGTDGTTNTDKDTHLSRFTNLWNGGRDYTVGSAVAGSSKLPYIPEPIVSARDRLKVGGASGKTPYPIEQLANSSGDVGRIGTWRFYLRNSTELQDQKQGLRGWIDSNPRVMASNMRLDGSKVETNGRQGWNVISNMIAGAHKTGAKHGDVGDGKGGDRGLVAEGNYVSNMTPQGIPTPGRWQGFGGPGTTATTGFTNVVIYDVPQSPLVSVGQFQHAQVSRYNYEPGFVVGNSYANPRIPLDKTSKPNFGGMGFDAVDISYETNKKIWDKAFFSTLGSDYVGDSKDLDKSFDFKGLVSGEKHLPNPRMIFSPLQGDTSFKGIIDADKAAAPQAMAARIMIHGAFNVNSTSKTAWKAMLSTMGSSELPVINYTTGNTSWADPKGIRFNRFGHPILEAPYKGGPRTAAFWQGWRELTEDELDKLAERIVVEVKARGPFKSMAEFVNRKPDGTQEQQRKGALQAAIDSIANDTLPTNIGRVALSPEGTNFDPNVIKGENQTAGHASYLLQGDVLQSLAPVMQVRSDYFRIRTCGEALDKNNKVIAKAWCEAFVQRMPEYVDSSNEGDKPEVDFEQLKSQTNISFGRRFQVVSFRWLSASEI